MLLQAERNKIVDLLQDVSPVELRQAAFKRGLFDFITIREDHDGKLVKHIKQEEALRVLVDLETEEFLYGGAAGGAKSWTGCAWLLFMCLNYDGTKWFIGREELKRITESTLLTFFKVCTAYGLKIGVDFKYNGQKNYIHFPNGSRIDLIELKYKPSDPQYERFGSLEYTGGWIEEAGEINFGAYDVLKTRIGRQYNDKYGLIGKLFITCNPKKNWLYTEFYMPAKRGELPAIMKYMIALVQDNPFIDSGYIDRLKRTKDKSKKERLLHGNWEYDDDPNAMCQYDDICAIFQNSHVLKTGIKYIIADVARYGSDRARIGVFDGWVMIEHVSFDISATTEIQDCINALRAKHGIPNKHCLADDDGVGGGVVDNCAILGFNNNGKTIKVEESRNNDTNRGKPEETIEERPNYQNLQTQCAYHLAGVINEFKFWIEADVAPQDQEQIKTELSWLKTYKSDDERKLRIIPKEKIKEAIGCSPDWRDLFLMRSYFDLVTLREAELGW